MRNRLALVLSATALGVSLLGATPVGSAAVGVVKRALFAVNAGKVNGIKAAKKPKANQLLALGKDAKFPLRTNGTSAAAAGSLGDPPANPDATITQTQITTSSPGRIVALGRFGVISYPCGGAAGTSCNVTAGLYVDGQPVPQTAAAGFPFCSIPGNPCFTTISGANLFGVVGVGAGEHTVTLAVKVTSGTIGTPTTAPTGEVGGIAVG